MQKDKVQRMQGIGLIFIGLGNVIVIGSYACGLSTNFTVMGVILFLIGAFYFGKSEVIRRKTHKN